jgi:hypothetical protein
MIKLNRMKLLALLLLTAPAFAQTGAPALNNFGKFACGARSFGTTQVQTWCYQGPPWRLVHNTIQILDPGSTVTVCFIAGADSISWLIKGPGPYQYQLVTSASPNMQAGTLPLPGAASLTAARRRSVAPPPPPPPSTKLGKIITIKPPK